jgi:hypothetical protein
VQDPINGQAETGKIDTFRLNCVSQYKKWGQCATHTNSWETTLTMFPTNLQLSCLSINKFMFIAATDHVLAVVVTHVRRYLLVM